MLCLWPRTFNHVRHSLDGFTSRPAPIHAVVRAPASCDHEIYTAAVLNLSFILGLVACRYFPSIIEGEAS